MIFDVMIQNTETGALNVTTIDAPTPSEARKAAREGLATPFEVYKVMKHKSATERARRACTVIYAALEKNESGTPVMVEHLIEVVGTNGSNEARLRALAKKQGNKIPSCAIIKAIAPHKPDEVTNNE